MTQPKNPHDVAMDRRTFVKQAGLTTFGGTLSLGLINQLFANDPNQPAEKKTPACETKNRVDGMSYIPLGKTNLMVSRLSLGGLPCQPMVMRKAIDAGVNLIHGSNGYGSMGEQAKVLKPVWDKVWFFLKFGHGEDDMGKCLDNCLKTLNRDYVDAILPVIGAKGEGQYAKIKEDFEKFKKAGKVRILGATVHTNDISGIIKEVVDTGIFEVILTMYQLGAKEAADKELVRAVAKNIGTMSMKTIQGAKDDEHAKVAAAALSGGTIHTLLKGFNSMSSLDLYLKVAQEAGEVKTAANLQDCADPNACGACGLCLGCPKQIPIPEIMRCATYYDHHEGLDSLAKQTYKQIPAQATVLGCQDCGQCEGVCPRGLPVREILRLAHQRWA